MHLKPQPYVGFMVARFRPQKLDIDWVARRVLMSAVAYYGLDEPIADDATYDSWCKELNQRWDELGEDYRWQLREPEDVLVTGIDFRITMHTMGGLTNYLIQHGLCGFSAGRTVVAQDKWRWSEKRGVHFLFPGSFGWG